MPDQNQKRPFHEVLSQRLANIGKLVGLIKFFTFDKAVETSVLLDVLSQGKMPSKAAHEIAEQLGNLPDAFRSARREDIAVFAEEVLSDLRSREDDKKTDQQPITA